MWEILRSSLLGRMTTWQQSTHSGRPSSSTSSTGQYFLNDRCFRIRIVLNMLPIAGCQFALSAFVLLPVFIMSAQPVTKYQHAPNFLAPDGKDVKVAIDAGGSQKPVLKPSGFPDFQCKPYLLERRHIRRLVGRIRHGQNHIDYRFRR